MKIYSVKEMHINEFNLSGIEVGATYYRDIEEAIKDYCRRCDSVRNNRYIEIIREDKSFEGNTLGCFVYYNIETPETKIKVTLNRHDLK